MGGTQGAIARVLDPTHLELTEPLTMHAGAQVAVTVTEDAREPVRLSVEETTPTQAPRTLRFRQREDEWSRTHSDALMAHAGQWVVLEGEDIIVHGADPAELVRQARDSGIRSPYIFYVEPSQPGVVKIGL